MQLLGDKLGGVKVVRRNSGDPFSEALLDLAVVDIGELVHAAQVDHHRLVERRRGHPLERALEHLDGVAEVPRVHEAERLVVQRHGVRGVRLDAALVLPHRRREVLGHDALERAVASQEVGVLRGVGGVGGHGLHVAEGSGGRGEVADLHMCVGEAGEEYRVARLAGGYVGQERECDIELAVG
ncbi:hypothetical protein EJB05_21372, partial [Eragrostis curvula]